ncbi:FixH family protein [Mesorhizobium sp. LHD-90]|uniref:FixH family protein n=1 Tax=Mesorhizobium sp. LHD-90 TaxID=3071414 RepID=UPI0027E0BB3B|nr:FixH family protein [Mesorhizobium sp. LHD-90]MDQ6433161.1 FixH family protein [Mesorhizobium sp. LHD-90]
MHKKSWGIIVIPVLALVALFCFAQIYLTAPRHDAPDVTRAKSTENKLFVASIAPEGGEPKVGPLSSWMLTLRLPNGHPVRNALISLDGGMPDHNHGLPTKPTVSTDLGEGHYRIEGLKFTMPGVWVLKLVISTADFGSDEATFNVVL